MQCSLVITIKTFAQLLPNVSHSLTLSHYYVDSTQRSTIGFDNIRIYLTKITLRLTESPDSSVPLS